MKFSSKIEKCNLSPIRKFYPYQVECKKQGKKIYPLNIGQPDIKTPEAYFEARYRHRLRNQRYLHHHWWFRSSADRSELHPGRRR